MVWSGMMADWRGFGKMAFRIGLLCQQLPAAEPETSLISSRNANHYITTFGNEET
jgi:hypothetical protein